MPGRARYGVPDPASLRDSTQIVIRRDALCGIREELESRFTLTIVEREGRCRIIGSPVVIREVGDFLVNRGVSVP